MTVAKFGGTSVATADAIRRLVRIVSERPDVRVVVVSALAGVTDQLVAIVDSTEAGRAQEAREAAERIAERHRLVAANLGLPAEAADDIDQVARGLGEQLTAMAEACDGRPGRRDEADVDECRAVFARLRASLSAGTVRAAEPDEREDEGWRVNTWVKQGILVGFRCGRLADRSIDGGRWPFVDKDTLPLKAIDAASGVRIVPGGSSVRDGAYLARGVIAMPPMYVNIGAHVGADTLIDSHALVGSCAQIGERVHLSAGAQIGGVIEPVGALPVIVEDDVLVGGNTGIYEGAIVKARAVIAAGTVLTGSTPIYDLVHERVIQPGPGRPLVVPAGAVVVPGARAVTRGAGAQWGLSLATPVIVKYRDSKTDSRTGLEQWIR